jgi:hypothetical protein
MRDEPEEWDEDEAFYQEQKRAAVCAHEWNVGLCVKCFTHHDCVHFVDGICVTCGADA